MASYKRLENGKWEVQVSLGYFNGKKIIKKKRFNTKKEAKLFESELQTQYHNGYTVPSNNNMQLKDFINKWFYEYKINTLSINTIMNYETRINTHIIPRVGSYKLNKITNMVVQEFYNSLINEGAKPSTAKKIIETLNNCLKYAYKNKLIPTLPTDIERISIEKPKILFWDKDEVDLFLHEYEEDYLYTPVLICLMTGLRIGELCGLKWGDIDLNNNYLNVTHQVINDKSNKRLIYTDKLKTSTSYRKVTLPDFLVDYLKELKHNNAASKNDFVVLTREGTMCNPRNLSMNFRKSISKYKPVSDKQDHISVKDCSHLTQISFHALRHTHATLLIQNNENIKVVSERLGHSSITETLDTYTHIIDDMRNNTATLLDNIFASKIEALIN